MARSRGTKLLYSSRGSTRYFLPGIPTTYHLPRPNRPAWVAWVPYRQAAPLRAAPAMERRARAHASKRRGAHKHPRLPLLLQIHPLRSVARRARIGPTRTGLHRRGSARARGKGRERRADHLPHPLPHLASKRCRRRSFCTLPPPRVGRGPPPPRVNPPLPSPRRARASLPPPSLRSAHAPPLFRIPGPAGPLVARRSPPLTRPRPCPPRHRCSPPSPRRTRRRSVRRPPLEPRARAPSRATNSAAPQRAHIPNLHSQLLCSLGLNLPPGSPGRAPIEFRSVGRDIQGDAQSQKPAPHIARLSRSIRPCKIFASSGQHIASLLSARISAAPARSAISSPPQD